MDKRKKMILSITGIVIVLLFIIGFTFGYVLLKIKGNENSILSSLTSKKVSVAYKEISNTSNGETISPGYEFIKTFTATNDGNVEVNYHIYLDNVENEFTRVQDITYTLYRSELNGTIDTSSLSDSDIVASGTFPTTDAYIKFNEEIETPNNYYTYALKINYAKTTDSQDEDDGHIFSFRVQLDLYYPFEEGTLAYNILNNSLNETNGTIFSLTSLTKTAQEVSGENESVLSITRDDLGTSYYYRGNVKNNYVNFAGMCWRIVRVQGDGSTKLILEDKNTTCESSTYTGNWSLGTGNYGYDGTSGKYKTNYLNPVTDNTYSMVKAFYDFQTTNLSGYTDKLKAGDWCLGDTAYTRTGSSSSDYTYTLLTDISSNYSSGTSFYYDAYARITGDSKDGYSATLKCNGTKLDKFATVEGVSSEAPMYVSAITADEVAFAGGKYYSSNQNYYLTNEEFKEGYDGVIGSYYFWILSPSYFTGTIDYAFGVSDRGVLNHYILNYNYGSLRPAVSLASGTQITGGDGTKSNPYIIN